MSTWVVFYRRMKCFLTKLFGRRPTRPTQGRLNVGFNAVSKSPSPRNGLLFITSWEVVLSDFGKPLMVEQNPRDSDLSWKAASGLPCHAIRSESCMELSTPSTAKAARLNDPERRLLKMIEPCPSLDILRTTMGHNRNHLNCLADV